MTSRLLRSLSTAFKESDVKRTEQIFYDITHSLTVVHFDPLNSKYQSDLLISMMNTVLPFLSHSNLKMRLQAESFLGHWSSLISAFSPDSLLNSYNFFDAVSTLQPNAQAIIFNFFTNTICSIPPSQRIIHIGTCHCMLMSSKPALLTKLAQDVWVLLRAELTVSNVASIVKFLVNSSIPKVVSFLCMKDPDELFPIVARDANLQFLKEFIPHWPTYVIVDVNLLRDRIVESLNSSNSSDISAGIEIVQLIADRMFIPPLLSQFNSWKAILNAMNELLASNKCTVSHKAALIDLSASLSKFEMISQRELQKFLVFNLDLPTTLQVSIIKLSACFVIRRKLPVGLIEYLKKQAILRDPLLYVAVLNFLQKCFNDFFLIAPQEAKNLLDLCLHPLPRYFVEQLQILRLFNHIDWNVFLIDMLPMKLIDIILGFLKEPHPSVVSKLSKFIQKMRIELPYAELNWFEDSSYYLSIFHNLDPSFIIELLDANMIPSASYPIATEAIAESLTRQIIDNENAQQSAPNSPSNSPKRSIYMPFNSSSFPASFIPHFDSSYDQKDESNSSNNNPISSHIYMQVFSRAIPIILEGIKALGFELDSNMKSLIPLISNNWARYSEKMPQLLEIISESFPESTFGKIIENSLKLIVLSVNEIKLKTENIIGLINIARIFASCFTDTTCQLLLKLKDIKFDSRIQSAILHFFDRALPFSHAEIIALTAVQTIPWENLLKLKEYLEVAADTNGEILIILDLITNENAEPHKSFLALKNNHEYVEKCMEIYEFDEWMITRDDFDYISTLSNIKAELEKLDDIHKEVIHLYPKTFSVKRKQRKYSRAGDFTFKFDDSISLGYEYASMENIQPETIVEKPNPAVPFNPYNSSSPSRTELFTFLWFSDRSIESIQVSNKETNENLDNNERVSKWSEIEKYAIEISDDEKFVAAFFSYARRKNLHIDLKEWPSLLSVNRNSDYSLISVALYFSFIKNTKYNELDSNQLDLIERTAIELGIQTASEFNLLQAVKTLTGLDKLVIESIISIDSSRFGEIPYFSITKIEEIFEIMKNDANSMFLPDCLHILSQNLLPSLPISHHEQFNFPPNVDVIKDYINTDVKIKTRIKKITQINSNTNDNSSSCEKTKNNGNMNETGELNLDVNEKEKENEKEYEWSISNSIVQLIVTSRNCDLFIFYFLNCIDFSREQFLEIIQQIPPGHPLYSYYLTVKLTLNEQKEYSGFTNDRLDKLFNFIANKPPSYSRELIAILLDSKNKYDLILSKSDKNRLIKLMPPVFYELLFKGFDLISTNLYDKRFPFVEESVLSLSVIDKDSFKYLNNVIQNGTHSSYNIIKDVYRLNNNELCQMFNTLNVDLAKLELCDRIASLLAYSPRYMCDTVSTMKQVLKQMAPDQLMTAFISNDFLNAPLQINVFLCVKMIVKAMVKMNNDMSKKNIEIIQAMIENRVTDKKLLELFESTNDLESLSILCESNIIS
ncbi:hypothetical protein TRFO_07205 [Tritrichomonas foetus]|uniref:Uncharacterized protein n=1 Tax=Tritrichomonas foetus TaxID=1144522 RepID=A0A1J4JYK5_9EUKA|nr:hypothetical protein TRFO_07205 [Tritrichomonas foetus]|eukprot:OHT02349.1 hypothetical protein TRFO_07205 [Tritrichomonas foetus]